MSTAHSILRSKSVDYKAQSIKLVTISHPLIPKFNEDFCREKIGESINGLESLYNSVDYHFLILPCMNSVNGLRKWADEALDGYLGLLDVCATTKDVLSNSRQDLQQLLSILRRRKDSNDFGDYLSSTSKAKKAAHKSLKNLKVGKYKKTLLADEDHYHGTMAAAIVNPSNEAEMVTLTVLQALLSYIAGTTRSDNWCMVRKLMNKKRNIYINDLEKINDETSALASLDKVKYQLRKMDASLKGLEEGLEYMFRRLIRIRVSLLNVLNN